MDYNNFNNGSEGTKYRATRNLNTALENPQFNVSDTFDVNLGTNNNSASNEIKSQSSNLGDNGNNSINNVIVENGNNIVDNNIEKKEVERVSTSFASSNYNNISSNVVNDGNTFVNSDISNNQVNNYNVDVSNISDDVNNEVSITKADKATYAPTGKKRKKKVFLAIPAELRILIILVVIILLFIYVIPNLYEFFRSIRLSILR